MGSWGRNVIGLSSDDSILAWIGPIGLAAAAGTGLIVDSTSQVTSQRRSLADWVEAGPNLEELAPGRRGIASIPAGPIDDDQLLSVLRKLSNSWPAVVLRLEQPLPDVPTVPYRPILPGLLAPESDAVAVWQPASQVGRAQVSGPVLPTLRRRDTIGMAMGRMPTSRRWIASWQRVWEMPWR